MGQLKHQTLTQGTAVRFLLIVNTVLQNRDEDVSLNITKP